MAPLRVVGRAGATADRRLRFRFLLKLADALSRRSDGGGTAVGKQRDVASIPVIYHPMTNAGGATAAKAHQTVNLTLGILGAVLTGLFLICFVAYNVRLAMRGDLRATYKRKFRCLRARLASAGRGVGSCFRQASWKRLPGNLKWFFSSQNGCWTCACLRAPKNDDAANNNNNNNSVSDDQTAHSPSGSGGGIGLGIAGNNSGDGRGSPFKSHIGPDISHLFKDSDSDFAGAVEPPIEMHPALRRDSAMLAATSAGDAAVAARQNRANVRAAAAAPPPLRHTMSWPSPPRSADQGSSATLRGGSDDERWQSRRGSRQTTGSLAAGPEGWPPRPPSRRGPLSSHPMDQQRWHPNFHQQQRQQLRQQQYQQQHQHHQQQPQHAVAPPPPARGGGPPVLPLDLPDSSAHPPAKSRPTSVESTYYSGLLEHARPWLLWANSPPPERTLAPAPGPSGGVTRSKSRSNRLSWLMERGRSRRASAVLEG